MATNIAQWGRFEGSFVTARSYADRFHDVTVQVTFTSPSGRTREVAGFWDGDDSWRVRFSPDEQGEWSYRTQCSEASDSGLHDQAGGFTCVENFGSTCFDQHGPVRIADEGRYLVHMDGTPFFWLADTVWAGPLLATDDEWSVYLRERTRQRFTAAQWVTTQFVGAPDGDREGELAFTGREQIALNPGFFQRLDKKLDALNDAGLLGVPVLLWAAVWGNPEVNATNPGYTLPDNEAIALARYMIARWGAHHVAWILNGDGDYRGEKADRWQRIGRAVFGGLPSRAPVMLHPAGMHWIADEFRDEAWVDIVGYQSGHGDDDPTLRWIFAGPPATEWPREPRRPIINLEPPYEYHIAYQSKQRFTPHAVRRALYWSLLNAPTAGVTYGGHGVWGWDDGTKPPANHPSTGIPLPWREALLMPGAEHVAHIAELFTSLDWWRLRPSLELLAEQPGERAAREFIAVAGVESNDLIVAYVPEGVGVSLRAEQLPERYTAYWIDPRSGERSATEAREDGARASFMAPPSTGDAPHDWVLVLSAT